MIIKEQIKYFVLHLIKLLDEDEKRFYEVGLETRINEYILRVVMINGLVTGIVLNPKDKELFVKIFDFITGL